MALLCAELDLVALAAELALTERSDTLLTGLQSTRETTVLDA